MPDKIRAVKCKECENGKPCENRDDVLCSFRKIFLNAGKKRRCEYFTSKPIKKDARAHYRIDYMKGVLKKVNPFTRGGNR